MINAGVSSQTAGTWKTSGVDARDLIRVLRPDVAWLVRDGMTVGEFLASVPERRAGHQDAAAVPQGTGDRVRGWFGLHARQESRRLRAAVSQCA